MRSNCRELRCAVEYRADPDRGGPGRLAGVLLEYGAEAALPWGRERFAEGALRWAEGGVVLNVQHDRAQALARFSPTVQGRRVLVDIPLPDTQRARDAVAMVRAGVLTGLSIEFAPLSEMVRDGVREIRSAELVGAGLVDSPAYPASVVAARAAQAAESRDIWL